MREEGRIHKASLTTMFTPQWKFICRPRDKRLLWKQVYINLFLKLVTARKRSLRRLCIYTCLSVILFTGGRHAWLQGGGACMVGGCAWLQEGGVRGCRRGACVAVGGMRGGGGRGHAWDTTRYGQWAAGTHPTGMHSRLHRASIIDLEWRIYIAKFFSRAHPLDSIFFIFMLL